ncbi:MAG TPA: hypothetical protein VKV40_16320 [Ktedonobacteraceae bacterium]|nr:hypothetical protein [Ktedonobacteraceae bacterium]
MEFSPNGMAENVPQDRARSDFVPGLVVVYVLREDQFPAYPEKQWRGKVKKVYSSIETLEIEMLEKGYEGLVECVYFKQVVRVESEQGD